jgi:hypothetical protein
VIDKVVQENSTSLGDFPCTHNMDCKKLEVDCSCSVHGVKSWTRSIDYSHLKTIKQHLYIVLTKPHPQTSAMS